MDSTQVAAKVLKRSRQLGRLGARGLVRTAYVRTLGPSVYAVTEPARALVARLHAQREISRDLPLRLARLKERTDPGGEPAHGPQAGLGQFVQALEATLDLRAAGCAVPRVSAIDWSSNVFAYEPVTGTPFSEYRRRQRLDEAAIRLLEEALRAIHRAGYAVGEIDADDVHFSPAGEPVICNLRRAVPLAGLSRDLSIHFRDSDSRRFNRLFGTRLLTAEQLRKLLSPSAGIPRDELQGLAQVYAPVVMRSDIRWGKIWNTDLGIGRWNFIMKEHLPIPVGGSVLDLGSNNGFNPLQMLRAGAASAVGVEIHEPAIEQATFLKAAYEWLDNRSYDFRSIHGSHADLPAFDLPRFDVVTALCTLYYLPEPQIRALVRYIQTLTDVLVVQCNTDRLIDRSGQEETYRKASVEFAIEMLDQAGFANRQVVAPPGYSRPLVIGRP